MKEVQTPVRDVLDDKVTRVFAGKVVRKDLARKVKVGANVPVFVLEYLLANTAPHRTRWRSGWGCRS
jgi:ATP-dependent Lon protease